MAGKRKPLDVHQQKELVMKLFRETAAGWQKERLNAVRLGLEGKQKNSEIAATLGIHPDTLNNWFGAYRKGGVDRLLKKQAPPGRPGALNAQQLELFGEELAKGKWRTGGQAYAWLQKKFGVTFHPNNIYKYLGKLGGRLKVPRPSHRKKDGQKAAQFKETFTQKLIDLELPKNRPVRFWIYDEMRYGLAPVTRRMWTSRGREIIAPVQHRYQWGYLFGALQIGGGGSEFLYSPTVSKDADAYFLRQISQRDPHAIHVIVGDGAGFHHRDKTKNKPLSQKTSASSPCRPIVQSSIL